MSTFPYEDILMLPHPTSRKYPRMAREKRAAQFAPFAALTGYDDAVEETARLTQERIELTEEERAVLDETLRELRLIADSHPFVMATVFRADERKAGGHYEQVEGHLKKIDETAGELMLEDGTRLPVADIIGLEPGER